MVIIVLENRDAGSPSIIGCSEIRVGASSSKSIASSCGVAISPTIETCRPGFDTTARLESVLNIRINRRSCM